MEIFISPSDMRALFDCHLCCLPLKPPVFKCKAMHAACSGYAASCSNQCALCGGVYEHIHWLDTIVLGTNVRCPNEAYGCRSLVPYCMAADHQLVCAHAPCWCPEPGCIFLGSPPTLRDHLASHHHCIVLEMAADEGDNVALVVASERGGAGERHVKVVRIRRASAEERDGVVQVQGA